MHVTPPVTSPTEAQIRRERDRILTSNVFASSQRMRELFDYLVAEARADRAARLKEFAIGIAVFGRDETYDPRIDAVVRVEVGRLRAKLREYYTEDGQQDPVRIEIPKGSYVPTFTLTDSSATQEPSVGLARGRGRLLALSVLVAVIGVASVLMLWRPESPDGAKSAGLYSLAVLPLRDWSPAPEDYFSEAMTDVLIARLSEKPQLRVTSLSSVMSYKNAVLPPSRIAEALGVDRIVEGAVFRDAGNVRITANLIDGGDGGTLWSKTFNRPMTNVLTLQAEVASEIAAQLVDELSPPAGPGRPAINPLAYEAFLKGIYWRNRLTEQGFNRGILYFQQAIELQSDYAEAYAGLAACHCRLGGHGIEVVRPDVALPQAVALANKALQLDDSLAEPNAVIGMIKFKYDWDPVAAERYLRRAIETNPSLFEAYLWLSQIAEGTGRHEVAVEQARLAHRLNPLSLAADLNLGWQLYQAGQTAEAENEFRKLLEFDPEFWGGHWGIGFIHRARGNLAEAIASFARAVELKGGHSLPSAGLGYTYALAGQRDRALAIVESLEASAEKTYISPVHIAMIYAGLGEHDAAFEWLDKAFTVRARTLAWLSVTHEFDGLRDDPRYGALVSAVGIAQ